MNPPQTRDDPDDTYAAELVLPGGEVLKLPQRTVRTIYEHLSRVVLRQAASDETSMTVKYVGEIPATADAWHAKSTDSGTLK